MKYNLLSLLLLMGMTAFGQSLPMDFNDPNDANWNGFGDTEASVTTDPVDSTNAVLQLVGATGEFDGASISLDTYIDLSDDANNTITFDMYTPLDGSSSNNHLFKLEGGPSGATELEFTTSGTGWQEVSIDFPAGLGSEYPVISLFTDAGVGNTVSATYYIDNIEGPNGGPVPVTPMPDGPAPDPTTPNAEALSVYSDAGYTNLWVRDYNFGTATEVNLDPNGTNNALQLNFQNAGYGEGTNNVTDISEYDSLHFDYWADANSSELIFFVIGNNGGAVVNYPYTINTAGTNETIVNEAWTHVAIPLSYFEGLGFVKENFFQWLVDRSTGDVSDFVYVDNIYFSRPGGMISDATLSDLQVDGATVDGFASNVLDYTVVLPAGTTVAPEVTAVATDTNATVMTTQAAAVPGSASVTVTSADSAATMTYTVAFEVESTGPQMGAPDPTEMEENVISLFSDSYNDVNVDTWNTSWSNASFEDDTIAGNPTKKYTMLGFNGIETTSNPVDASEMDYFHMDIWSPDMDSILIKLVDFLGDGFGGANGDTEAELTFAVTKNEWMSFQIPLADFAALGMTSFADINQYVISSRPFGTGTLYVDNVYFSKEPTSTNIVVNKDILVYPNPVRSGEDIIVDTDVQSDIMIFNNQGVLIRNVKTNRVSMEGVIPGIYFLRITDQEGNVSSQPVIVE